jgi:hypothetical protein
VLRRLAIELSLNGSEVDAAVSEVEQTLRD